MLKIGIVGAGLRGKMYARSLRAVPGVEVEALCDLSPQMAETAGKELGLRHYTSHRDLYSEEQLDAVIVATPDFAHFEPAVDAARAGLHMMIEKPLAIDEAEAQGIRAAVQESGVQCMVAFENRWNPAFVRAHEIVRSGAVGEVLTQTARLSNTYYVPTRMLSWSGHSSPGWFLMPHTLDLTLWLSGKAPEKVYATGFKRELVARGIDTWDVIHALITFTDGTTASLESLWILPDSMPSVVDFKYQLIGSKSAIFVNQQDQMLWAADEKLSFPNTLVLDVDGRPQGFPSWMVASFARQLLEDEALSPTIDEGVRVTQVISAIHESLADGMPHTLAGPA